MNPNVASRRVVKTGRPVELTADGHVERINGLIVADKTLVVLAIFFENVRLPGFAQAESIPDRIRDVLRAIRDNVDALIAVALDSIIVASLTKLHERVAPQHTAFRIGLSSMRHRS